MVRETIRKIPEFLRYEIRSVREYFLAGIIDSDGYTNNQIGTFKIKIPSAYQPIKDGILSISRSLGLNVTMTFDPEREREDFNQSDTWVIHLLEGANRSVFWSILMKCSCERKKNLPNIGHCRTPLYPPSGEASLLNPMPMTFDTFDLGSGKVYSQGSFQYLYH